MEDTIRTGMGSLGIFVRVGTIPAKLDKGSQRKTKYHTNPRNPNLN